MHENSRKTMKCLLMLVYLQTLAATFCTCQNVSDPVIKIYTEQDRIELGGQLKISCQATRIKGIPEGIRKWYNGTISGTTSVLLCQNGTSFYPDKYHEERLSDVKYQLTIKNITDADINCKYACHFGIPGVEKTVSSNDFYFNTPTAEMIQTEYMKTENNYSITVTFHKVYPVPSCTVKLKSQFKNFTYIRVEPNGSMYDVKLTDLSEEPYHICNSTVNLQIAYIDCMFGKTISQIPIHHNSTCSRHMPNPDQYDKFLWLLLLLLLIVIIAVVYWVQKRRKGRMPPCPTTNDIENKGHNHLNKDEELKSLFTTESKTENEGNG